MGFGVSQFIALTDTPQTYIGHGGKHVKVDTLGKALEFGAVMPLPPVNLLGCLYEQSYNKLLEDWVEAVTGSGTTTYNPYGFLEVSTGTTADSTAMRSYRPILADINAPNDINWDDEHVLQFFVKFFTGGIATTKFGYARLAQTVTPNVLGVRGIGFIYNRSGDRLLLESHDGVARQETDLGVESYHENLFSSGAHGTVLRIHHRPNGQDKVEFYELNTGGGFDLIGTHTTRVPSGQGDGHLVISANNQGQNEDMKVTITHATLYRPIPVIPV